MHELILNAIKKGKEQVAKGKSDPVEFAMSLVQIYQKEHEFSGMTIEEFFEQVRGL